MTPTLTWPTKSLSEPLPADLVLEAVTYPQGESFTNISPENRTNHFFA